MVDTKRIVKCPACDKEMTKIFIKDCGFNIDICLDGCGGVLFNNRELEKFDEEHENADEIFEAIQGRCFHHVNTKEVRICSICGTPMVKHGTGIEGVEVDVCNICGAKFLDNGELEKIREFSTKKSSYNAIQDEKIDAVVNANPVQAGGAFGAFAKSHIKTTKGRNATENFIRELINNKDILI